MILKNLEGLGGCCEETDQTISRDFGLQGKPFTEKGSPLNVTKNRRFQKKGYRIEKLYYESLPSIVPANLYIQ